MLAVSRGIFQEHLKFNYSEMQSGATLCTRGFFSRVAVASVLNVEQKNNRIFNKI